VLGNLINRHDAVRLGRRLRRGHVTQIAAAAPAPGPGRVLARRPAAGRPAGQVQWDEIPAIRRRWHTFGPREASFAELVTGRWLAGRSGLRALSLGAGPGDREIGWARLGVFAHITGVDISPEQTERATARAREAGLDDALSFHVTDARQALREAEGRCDVVLALNALNHFGHLEEIMRLAARALGPGGLLIMDEYVGPSRFQWASAQLRAANTLLAALPEQHRILPDGQIKRRVARPSRLSMRLDNPSEAAESSDLMPALHRRFTILEEHPYGSILHLALHGIACNFLADDPDTAQAIQACLAAEERALPRLGADFVRAVCSPRAGPWTGLEAGHVTALRARTPARLGYDAT
jgi:SAM-dependent methyltransferase